MGGLELKYEDALKKQYNGNIGQSKWKVARVAASPQMSYDFEYDKINRLVGEVINTNMQGNDRCGDKTAVAVGKAIVGIVGGSIGAILVQHQVEF